MPSGAGALDRQHSVEAGDSEEAEQRVARIAHGDRAELHTRLALSNTDSPAESMKVTSLQSITRLRAPSPSILLAISPSSGA